MLFRRLIRAPAALRVFLPLLLVLAAWGLDSLAHRIEAAASSPFPLSPTPRYGTSLPAPDPRLEAALAELPLPLRFEPGETLAEVLDDLGVAPQERSVLAKELSEHVDLRRLRPGDEYAVKLFDSRLSALELRLRDSGVARAYRDGAGWRASWHAFERRARPRGIAGELAGSLEGSIREAGGEIGLAVEMADTLQWDLDFTRDLRLGDTFNMLYEQIYLDGNYHSLGPIEALWYTNRGRRLEAYRFDPNGSGDPGYYDAQGRPLRKMFLRSPLRYSRISSRFSHRRFHPILKLHRPHYGVDYGAPTGTPVRATAVGKVVFAGWDRGGGRTVKIRHANSYLTAYLHLSRFAKGVSPGRRVAQGEVIGYVGATGLATGPHLDYRVQHHGRWIDPLTLKSTPAEPLATERLPEFFDRRDQLIERLAGMASGPRSEASLAQLGSETISLATLAP